MQKQTSERRKKDLFCGPVLIWVAHWIFIPLDVYYFQNNHSKRSSLKPKKINQKWMRHLHLYLYEEL